MNTQAQTITFTTKNGTTTEPTTTETTITEPKTSDKTLFEQKEASVRSYCRNFPTVFTKAQSATLTDEEGREYIDFLAGAGVMNYGHNNPVIKKAVMDYMLEDGIVQGLDLYTTAKYDFMDTLYKVILEPRGMDYKVTFPGPTGTNAVETALKIARLKTGRQNVIAFTNAFHGMTQGSLALTGNKSKREGAGMPLSGVTRMPFEGYMGEDFDTAAYMDKILGDTSGGVDAPAAIIVETIQAEGGLNVATTKWLQDLAKVAKKHGALFIIDDIQVGCGRTGTFFSFEEAGITPDIICLSKSIGGMGLPMSLLLLAPELDVLKPGQHNGTFRGNNLAFVAAKAALDLWQDAEYEKEIKAKSSIVRSYLKSLIKDFPKAGAHLRGRGMLLGISFDDAKIASKISEAAFKRGLVIETSGAEDQVLKLLPPLTITERELVKGLAILKAAMLDVLDPHTTKTTAKKTVRIAKPANDDMVTKTTTITTTKKTTNSDEVIRMAIPTYQAAQQSQELTEHLF